MAVSGTGARVPAEHTRGTARAGEGQTDTGPVLFRLADATVVRPTGETVFERLSWTVREGETWAVVGPVGSGKTALSDVLLGRLRVTAGTVEWPLVDRLRAAGRPVAWPSEAIGRVGFKEESRLFSYGRHYYQQRFNFIEPDDDLTLDEYLHAGTDVPEETLRAVTTRLGIADLRPLSFIKLSNGQTRRARIAKALLTHPDMLVLDEPFVGLDADGRREVRDLLRGLADQGTRLVLITSPDAVPEWVTNVLELTGLPRHVRRAAGRVPPAPTAGRRPRLASADRPAGEPVVELAA